MLIDTSMKKYKSNKKAISKKEPPHIWEAPLYIIS